MARQGAVAPRLRESKCASKARVRMFADMTWEALAAHSAARNLIVNGLQRDWVPRAVVANRCEAVGAAAHWLARGMARWQSVCGWRELWVSSFCEFWVSRGKWHRPLAFARAV